MTKSFNILCLFLATVLISVETSNTNVKSYLIKNIDEIVKMTVGIFYKKTPPEITDKPLESIVTFWCKYHREDQVIRTTINDPNIENKIDVTKPMYILLHGWTKSLNASLMQQTMRNLVLFMDVNVCGVDWSPFANQDYLSAANKFVFVVGDYVAKFIQYLLTIGFKFDDINLVGHSLGAHIVGYAGHLLQGQVGTIYGENSASFDVFLDLI